MRLGAFGPAAPLDPTTAILLDKKTENTSDSFFGNLLNRNKNMLQLNNITKLEQMGYFSHKFNNSARF